MKIGVMSDTHGDICMAEQAIAVLQDQGVAMVMHCGDVGVDIVPLFAGLTMHFVNGNMDNLKLLRDAALPEHTVHDAFATLEIDGRRVALLHGHDARRLDETIRSGHFDLVCHGHTHVFSNTLEGATRVLNPGALVRTGRPSVAVVDLPSLTVTEIPLS
jgi:putative phosphoesterase